MKAAVLHGPGDVRYEDMPDPSPAPGEIVVRTLAALTCGTDLKVVRRGYHARMLKPPCESLPTVRSFSRSKIDWMSP